MSEIIVESSSPLLHDKIYHETSVFTADNLLREARRQKRLEPMPVPEVCVLDPDGDIVRSLVAQRRAMRNPHWACYHSDMYDVECEGVRMGIVGCAVGAAYAVLVAEQMFASGCRLLISVTSSGQIARVGEPPYFVLVDKALRDEGTSMHYLPPSEYSYLNPDLCDMAAQALKDAPFPVYRGATWTTDAPFRETATLIERRQRQGILAVEMEASALYAFATACSQPVICLAHVTNQMAVFEGDFEKGEDAGSRDALLILLKIAQAWQSRQQHGQK